MTDNETKYLLLKHIHDEIHQLIKQHKEEMGFSNLDKAVESIVFLALVDYPEELVNLQNKIRNLENEIKEMKKL